MTNMRVIILLNIGIWVCIVPGVFSLLKIWGDIMSVIDNLQYTLPCMIGTLKFFIMWHKKKGIYKQAIYIYISVHYVYTSTKNTFFLNIYFVLRISTQHCGTYTPTYLLFLDILPLLNMIKQDWLEPKTVQERNVMIKRARLACMFTIFGYFIMFMSFFLFTILPVFGISLRYLTNKTDPGRLVPLQTYYFYDRDKSPLYEMTYALQTIGISIVAAAYTGTDCFLSLLVFHVCGQLENLKMRVINLDRFNNFESVLSRGIQNHIRLIRL